MHSFIHLKTTEDATKNRIGKKYSVSIAGLGTQKHVRAMTLL